MSGVLTVTLVAAFAVIPSVAFRRQPKFRDEYSVTFSPQGIHFRTTHIDSDLKWDMYTWALIDAHSFILYYGSQQFTVIPKRVFEGPVQRQAFEPLLRQHVSKVVDKEE
jgi:hypothetical protein